MSHYAEIGLNNLIIRVVVVANAELLDENGLEQEQRGADFCRNLFGGTWVQTSYNASFRKNFASAGFTYDSQRDAFIPPKPYASWLLDENTCTWVAPFAMPDDGQEYLWDEGSGDWEPVT